jgi:type I restriction enzyme M protein
MTRLTGELSGLFEESRKLEKEIKKRLGAIGWEV